MLYASKHVIWRGTRLENIIRVNKFMATEDCAFLWGNLAENVPQKKTAKMNYREKLQSDTEYGNIKSRDLSQISLFQTIGFEVCIIMILRDINL